ncbi:ATP-binding cassette domain-containing protein [Nonomuraea sp. NPDC050547]|uniref:ABC transporter ATP-binding protein n=1 Tax=Nonomuraea sp. NPDC050547 TaxID=3364368 RepID=UPI0037AF6BC3
MNTAIAVQGLHKSFGKAPALDALDLTVHTGEVHGFLGPNGSGKSTTIRILLGLMRADSGSVRLLGGDPWKDAAELHRRLAYVPGDVSLWPSLTGGEVIDLLGRIRGGQDRTRRAELLERFELDPRKKARTYSKGNRQKVALVAAFASDAELLILDEPTSGLDPLMEAVFQQCVAEQKVLGRTVLLSSHILSEVEALCDRVSIIRAGHTVESGTLSELRHLTMTQISAEISGKIPALPTARNLTTNGRKISFQVDDQDLDTTMLTLAQSGIVSLTSTPPSLEDLFMRHYAAEKSGHSAAGKGSHSAAENSSHSVAGKGNHSVAEKDSHSAAGKSSHPAAGKGN